MTMSYFISDRHKEVMEKQKHYAKLWLDVCEEQDQNNYNWKLTKKKYLSDWSHYETMTVDWWSEYMRAMFVEFAIEHYLIDREKAQ